MPTLLPHDPHVKTHAKTIERGHALDWIGAAALAAGFLGLALAAIVYVAAGDRFVVSYIMFITAAIVALILRWDVEQGPGD